MERMGIFWVAASYGIALILELTRLWFRSGLRGAMMVAFGGAGLAVHTVFLGYRAITVTGSPLSSEMDWCLLAAWVLVALYMGLLLSYPRTPFGIVLLPLTLALIGAAGWWANREPYPQGPASRIWGVIHAGAILAATVSVLLSFAAGMLYLYQAYRLKLRRPLRVGLRLPSLEWLARMNGRTLTIAAGALSLGIFAGGVLNWINSRQQVPPLPWNDPLVLSTLAMFGWLMVAFALALWYRPADEVRKVTVMTFLSFVFLVVALTALLGMDTSHGRTRTSIDREPPGRLSGADPAWGQTSSDP